MRTLGSNDPVARPMESVMNHIFRIPSKARASRSQNQDVISVAIVGMLAHQKEIAQSQENDLTKYDRHHIQLKRYLSRWWISKMREETNSQRFGMVDMRR
ncbi:hypothetical protein Tco_1039975 [Tanacetum coccineum]